MRCFPAEFKKYPNINIAVIVAWDTEWNWILEEGVSEYIQDTPEFVSFSISFQQKELMKYNTTQLFSKSNDNNNNDVIELFINYLVNLSSKIKFIDKKYKDLEWYVFSHNGGAVENQFIMRYISKNKKSFKHVFKHFSGNKIFSFKFLGFNFRDSLLFICGGGSLEAFHKSMFPNVEAKIPIWKNKGMSKSEYYKNKIWDVNNSEDVKYAKYDSIILLRSLLKYIELLNIVLNTKELNYLSAYSLSSIAKTWLGNIYKIPYNNPQIMTLFEKFYKNRYK